MASSFEKSVKGATKVKLAAPKSKYIEHILIATHTGEHGVAEVFRHLQYRLRDSTWTIVFKSLIVVHLLIREGAPDVTLRYLSSQPHRKLAINNFTEVQAQGRNIRAYSEYLLQRAISFEKSKVDYVRTAGDGRLKRLTVDKGLLMQVESVQDQIRALVRCDFFTQEPENDITMTAFRFLISDLISLFVVMNEGTVTVIEHFLEMSKPDAERAINIYRTFCKQTDKTVNYLSIARHYEHATRIEIPKLRHAPTNLAGSMEEYLKDPDFDINRRQYLAEQQSKKKGGAVNGSSRPFPDFKSSAPKSEAPSSFPETKPASQPSKVDNKGPAPDLIDFFESIEQNQTPMAQAQYHQPQYQGQPQGLMGQATGFQGQNPFLAQGTGMPVQPTSFPVELHGTPSSAFPSELQGTPSSAFPSELGGTQLQQPPTTANGVGANPFLQMQQSQLQQPQIQPNFTGAGFGGYTPQPQQPSGFQPSLSSIPQSGIASFSPSTEQPQFTPSPSVQSPIGGSNPFRQSMFPPNATGNTISSVSSQPTASSLSSLPSSMNPNRQSTNPFAKPSGTPQGSPFSAPSPFTLQQSSPFTSPPPGSFGQPPAQPLMPAVTGTNPFARQPSPASSSPFSSAPVSTNPTGSTNPFRQSQFVNQATGQGWQSGPQGTIGGFSSESIATVPIFPRPGAQQQQQTGQQGLQ